MLSRSLGIVNHTLPCRSRVVVRALTLAHSASSAAQTAPAGSVVAQNVQATHQSTISPQNHKKGRKAVLNSVEEPSNMEAQLQQLERLHAVEHNLAFDVWAHPLPLFDLRVPSPKGASITDRLRGFWQSSSNIARNAVGLYNIASVNGFPGVSVKSAWSTQLFKTQSTPWLKPFLRDALSTYEQINEALAAQDPKAVKKLTTEAYQTHLLERLQKQNPSLRYRWTLHGQNEPCKVVSIRAAEINLSRTPPKFGNRLVVQACVKFDSNQSLQVYNQKGQLLGGDGKPKHVVEYLVFEKRMWYDAPWVVRDQLYEGLEGKFKSAS